MDCDLTFPMSAAEDAGLTSLIWATASCAIVAYMSHSIRSMLRNLVPLGILMHLGLGRSWGRADSGIA